MSRRASGGSRRSAAKAPRSEIQSPRSTGPIARNGQSPLLVVTGDRYDPLGRFTFPAADFADLTRVVLAIARRHAGGRLVTVIEGGYDLAGLAAASSAHVKALTEA